MRQIIFGGLLFSMFFFLPLLLCAPSDNVQRELPR